MADAGSRRLARSELSEALSRSSRAFLAIGLFSGMINILMLTGSFFMLEIYDRVLPSRSVPTLVGFAILAGGLFASQGILDLIRGRLQVRHRRTIDEALSARVYDVDRPPAAEDRESMAATGSADARSRHRSAASFRRPVRRRPLRSAVDAALSRHLLSPSIRSWFDRTRRRRHPVILTLADRIRDPHAAKGCELRGRHRNLSRRRAAATPRCCMAMGMAGRNRGTLRARPTPTTSLASSEASRRAGRLGALSQVCCA